MLMPGPKCLQFEDTMGPYRTEEECVTRIVEMIGNIREISPNLSIVSTSCSPKNQISA